MQASFPFRVTTAALFVLLAYQAGVRAFGDQAAVRPTDAHSMQTVSNSPAPSDSEAFLYGRVTTTDGDVFEGRLRFGDAEEALWTNYFNGSRPRNPWMDMLPADLRLTTRRSVELFGLEVASRDVPLDPGRPFMVRFGDIRRIDASLRALRVTLKSGSVHTLDRFDADDFADGLRVWDAVRGPVELGEWSIRSIEFMPTPHLDNAPRRLHGRVHTRDGTFTGLVQWNREACLLTDRLTGFSADGERTLHFSNIHRIDRRSPQSIGVMLADGREVVLSNSRDTGVGHRGIYVDDARFGRVLVSWDAFERFELDSAPTGPGYDDFTAGRRLAGRVTTRSGRVISGRLVFDLDESETVETLDAPVDGVDYSIPFGMISSIEPARGDRSGRAVVELTSGVVLRMDPEGDLGKLNAGVLVFPAGEGTAEYVSWTEVERITFD